MNGSRPTKGGWKVSYHLVFPWLTFPCNDGLLKALVQESSDHNLQCPSRQGTTKSFVDALVYTQKRQFRTALSWKLDDSTTFGLRLWGFEEDEWLLLTFVTCTKDELWRIPDAAGLELERHNDHPPRETHAIWRPEFAVAGAGATVLVLVRASVVA